MILEKYEIPQGLRDYVEEIIYFKDFIPNHSIERIVPTGNVFVVFEFDGILRYVYDNQTLNPISTYSKVWISGIHKNFLSISAHANSEMLAVQFKPAGAFPFLHFPMNKIIDKVLPGEEVLDSQILKLHSELLLAKSTYDKFELVSNWLLNRFDQNRIPPKSLVSFVESLISDPISNFKSKVERYPFTQKQLIEHFKKYIGLTPKYYHRILRFNEILKKFNGKEEVTWTSIAYSCDYSDQSHFIKEFSLFSGFNPVEFIKMDYPKSQTNFFPIDPKG